MIVLPPRLPKTPVDDQPIDPTMYIPDLPDSYPNDDVRGLEDELLELEEYEDPTVIENWLIPYRPKQG